MKSSRTLLKADLIGATQRMRDTLSMVFQGPAKGLCAFADGAEANMVIVDVDGVGAVAAWEKYRTEHPGRPAVALSVKDEGIAHAEGVLVKPIKMQAFTAVLERLSAKLGEGAARKSAPNQPVPVASPAVAAAPKAKDVEPSTQKVPVLDLELERTVTHSLKPVQPPSPKDYSDVCGSAADIDIGNDTQARSVLMTLEGRLFGKLQKAVAEAERTRQAVKVSLMQKLLFVIDPNRRMIRVALDDEMLKRMCKRDFPDSAIDVRLVDGESPEVGGFYFASTQALLWKVAAWTYSGKLPSDTNLNERVYLRHWPNLTRLLELPDAMRISALIAGQPMRLTHVSEALGIPQRHVFAYYSSANAIGLMGASKRATDYLIEPPPAPVEQGNRRLFGQVMRHLRRFLS